MRMLKIKTSSGKIHFAMGGIAKNYKARLACQATNFVLAQAVTRETPITCKRCFSMHVYDVPTALDALGLRTGTLVAALFHSFGEEAEEWFNNMPGTEDLHYKGKPQKNSTDQKADNLMTNRLEENG